MKNKTEMAEDRDLTKDGRFKIRLTVSPVTLFFHTSLNSGDEKDHAALKRSIN
jgi:hypothetical protein